MGGTVLKHMRCWVRWKQRNTLMTIVSVKIAGRSAFVLASAMLAFSLSATGCANTVNGAKQDAATDAQKATTAADQAAASAKTAADQAAASTKAAAAKTAAEAHAVGQKAEQLPENAAAAATVTPEVKTALIRDPVLANSGNLINVNSGDHVVHLVGHVLEASMVARAAEDAQVAIAKRHPDFTVSNELTVSGK